MASIYVIPTHDTMREWYDDISLFYIEKGSRPPDIVPLLNAMLAKFRHQDFNVKPTVVPLEASSTDEAISNHVLKYTELCFTCIKLNPHFYEKIVNPTVEMTNMHLVLHEV